MGCNCGGSSASHTAVAQRTRAAAFRAAGSPPGFTADAPHLIGEADDVVRRVRVIQAVAGLTVGQAAHVTGTGVEPLLRSGALHDISRTAQKRRAWRVNGFTYFDEDTARRAAGALGVDPVEVA